MNKIFFGLVFLLGYSLNTSSQSFTCDGTFYISINQSSAPTTFYEITTAGGINFQELFMVDLHMNGTGLSTVDKNIYGVAFNTNEVFRVEANGTVSSVYTETDLAAWNAAAGAVNNNGVYAVHDRNMDMIFLYQTGVTVNKLGSAPLFWDPSTGNSGLFDHNIDDLVFDPFNDNIMYTYQRFWDQSGPTATRGHLLKVNVDMASPDFGMVSSVGQLDPAVIVHLGSLFFDTNGALHGYGSMTSSPILQDRLVKINQNNASIAVLGQGPQATGVDGCSCRNPMQLRKEAELIETTCDSNFIRYTIEVENLSMLETIELKLKDTLSFDGIITDMDMDGFVISDPSEGGIGSDYFIFDTFRLDGLTSSSFSFTVGTALGNTTVFNQARLYEIGVSSPIDSDDPSTDEISDPTALFLPEITGSISVAIDIRICEGEESEVNGTIYTESGEYIDSLMTSTGCDSILIIAVDVVENTVKNEILSLCPGESFVINGVNYDTPGNYVQMLTNAEGCDSTLNIQVVTDSGCDDCLSQYNGAKDDSISIVKNTNGSSNIAIVIAGEMQYIKEISDIRLSEEIQSYLRKTSAKLSDKEIILTTNSILSQYAKMRQGAVLKRK